MLIRFWGTRGSLATPGPSTNRYGGNTSCVEVRSGDTLIILDCGTGARGLGTQLLSEDWRKAAHLFLTHVHWDHIQGFPFFTPAFVPGAELHVYGAAALEQGLAEAMAGQMQATYFPVQLGDLQSRISFHQIGDSTFIAGDVEIRTQHLNHTCPTVGYRVRSGGVSIAYITDHEPFWPHNPDLDLPLKDALVHPGDQRHLAFFAGVDLLIHDAQYTAEEYPAKRGWGHSTIEYVVDVAGVAGVRRLALFHHDPTRDDDELDALVERARARAKARGFDLEILAAAEGNVLDLAESGSRASIEAGPPELPTQPPARVALLGAPERRRNLREALVEDGYRLTESNLDAPDEWATGGDTDLFIFSARADQVSAQTLQQLAKNADGRPILAVLDGDVSEDLLRQVSELVSDVLVAPFGPPNLRARVRACLARQQTPVAASATAAPTALFENLQAVDRLSGAELEALLRDAALCSFHPGEILFRQGDRPTGAYYIHGGRVRMIVHGAEGREVTVGFSGVGDTVGEMAVLDGNPRSATVVAVEPVRASYIPRDAFVQALERAPRASVRLLRLLTKRLRDVDQRMAQVTSAGVSADGNGNAPKEVVQQLERSNWRLAALLELSRTLLSELDRDRLLDLIGSRAGDILQAEQGTLFLVDYARNELYTRVLLGDTVDEVRLSRGEGLFGHVARTGETLNLPEEGQAAGALADATAGVSASADRPALAASRSVRNALYMPVRDLAGRIVGVLQVLNKNEGRFNADDEELLSAVGTQAAMALANAALVDARRKEVDKSNLLLDVMRSLSSELELDQLLVLIMAKATEVMQAERSSLFLVDHKTHELWFKVAQGSELTESRMPMTAGIAGHVASTGETVNLVDAYDDPRFNREIDKRTGYRTRSMLCMPMRDSAGITVGVLQVLNKKQGAFTWEDEDLLGAVGSQAVIALQNASLFEEVVRVKNYNESMLRSMATGVVALDIDGRVTTANPAAERILGFPDGLPAGESFAAVIRSRENKDLWDEVAPALKRGDARRSEKVRYVSPGNEPVTLNLSVVPLLDHQARRMGFVLVMEDISREQQLVGTLSRVVSRQVAEQLMATGRMPSVGGERQQVTVLMSDIRNFTTMTEKADPEEIVAMLNGYFGHMIRVVFKHGGTLDKFIGDAIMAVFGTPLVHDDDPLRAVRTAIDMRRSLREFNQERQAEGKLTIEIGVGIASGVAISGAIGSDERMEFTVIGDAVNTAARLEGLTKGYPDHKILFTESVYEAVKGSVPCDYLAEEYVKGRSQSVKLYGVAENFVFASPRRRSLAAV